MKIRKATLKDSESIAAHIWLAMEDIVYEFIGERDAEKGKELLTHFAARENNQYSYQNCWVVAEDEKVIAVANLYDGAKLEELRKPVFEYLSIQYGMHVKPEAETRAGEYYIDSLGVDPGQQGKGIGSMLLRFLIREYVEKNGQTLGLLVEEDNPNAKKLYLKLGFESVGKQVLVGKKMEHLQIKG